MNKATLSLLILISSLLIVNGQVKDTILIDLGNSANLTPQPWNNITNVSTGHIPDLINSYGFNTGMGLRVVDRFNTTSAYGTSSPSPGIGIPASATIDYFFGNTAEFGNMTLPTASVVIEGLDPNQAYTLQLFASRLHSNNLQTLYVIKGTTTDSLYLDVHTNTGTLVSTTLFPDTSGELLITATTGPNNNNAYGFYYLGAIKLIYNHVPFTNPPSLALISPNGGEYWQAGAQPHIRWNSESIHTLVLEYSTDLGATWQLIDTVKHYQEPFTWSVPYIQSKNCLVRITADTLSVTSVAPFEIALDTTRCTVVVLGSSTAAGSGASPSDSSWVNRFRYELFQKNTRFSVINLARGGYTTYHILPTGTVIPPGINKEVDTARNVTKALSYQPYAIIVNMPSNDASFQYTVTQQLTNFNLIHQTAANQSVRTWFCTPQPRNFGNPVQIQIQRDVTDSLLAIYGNYAIDFWNGLADQNGWIPAIYNSGDGIHLNNAGHRELFHRVWQHTIDTPGCAPFIGIVHHTKKPVPLGFSIYPNPATESITIDLENIVFVKGHIVVYDIFGHVVHHQSVANPTGGDLLTIPVSHLANGVYLVVLATDNLRYTHRFCKTNSATRF
jgi:lysophospholipase L1-like esterase